MELASENGIRTEHGGKDDRSSEEEMSLWVEGFVREEELFNDLATYEELERKGGKHVETETEACDVDKCVILKLDCKCVVVRREV